MGVDGNCWSGVDLFLDVYIPTDTTDSYLIDFRGVSSDVPSVSFSSTNEGSLVYFQHSYPSWTSFVSSSSSITFETCSESTVHRNIIHLVHHFNDRPTNSLVQCADPG